MWEKERKKEWGENEEKIGRMKKKEAKRDKGKGKGENACKKREKEKNCTHCVNSEKPPGFVNKQHFWLIHDHPDFRLIMWGFNIGSIFNTSARRAETTDDLWLTFLCIWLTQFKGQCKVSSFILPFVWESQVNLLLKPVVRLGLRSWLTQYVPTEPRATHTHTDGTVAPSAWALSLRAPITQQYSWDRKSSGGSGGALGSARQLILFVSGVWTLATGAQRWACAAESCRLRRQGHCGLPARSKIRGSHKQSGIDASYSHD